MTLLSHKCQSTFHKDSCTILGIYTGNEYAAHATYSYFAPVSQYHSGYCEMLCAWKTANAGSNEFSGLASAAAE